MFAKIWTMLLCLFMSCSPETSETGKFVEVPANQASNPYEICASIHDTVSYNTCMRNAQNQQSTQKQQACGMPDGYYQTGVLAFNRDFSSDVENYEVKNLHGFLKKATQVYFDVTEISNEGGLDQSLGNMTVFEYDCTTKKSKELTIKGSKNRYAKNKDNYGMAMHMMIPGILGTFHFGDKNADTLIGTIGGVEDNYFENHVIRIYNFKEQTLKTSLLVPEVKFSKREDCKNFCPTITATSASVISGRQYLYNYLYYRHHFQYSWSGVQLFHVVDDVGIGRQIPSFVPGYFQLSNLKDSGEADLIYIYPGSIFISDTQQVSETKKFLIDLKKNSYIWEQAESAPEFGKPVIYLYPQTPQQVQVGVSIHHGAMQVSYPAYPDAGWNVTAYPDGSLIDRDGKTYSYLFWEGVGNLQVDKSEGFIVAGDKAREFLQYTLLKLGLTPKEYNEFIVYWYPIMLRNKRNYVKFLQKEYQDEVTMDISPQPESLLRVFMYFEGIEKPFRVKEQVFQKFERKGFTVVERGGSEGGRE